MHFRVRGKVIQCVRTTYDAATKKPKAQVIGRVKKANPEIDDELRLSCTPEELAQLEAYLKNDHLVSQLHAELTTRSVVASIDTATEWLGLCSSSPENEVLALDILQATQRLRRTVTQRFGDQANPKGAKAPKARKA